MMKYIAISGMTMFSSLATQAMSLDCEAAEKGLLKLQTIRFRNSYIEFHCRDSLELRAFTKSNWDAITNENDVCRISLSRDLNIESYRISSCEPDSLTFQRGYLNGFSLSKDQIDGVNMDYGSAAGQYRARDMYLGAALLVVGLALCGYLVVQVLDGLDDYHMPDP